ncbi:MAG: hypothetical protein KDA71_02255 [Planctomycetales bacterium]|nr:hypothetical protein [Planctomycetales bacterium]
MIWRNFVSLLAATFLGFVLAGCDVDVKDPGKAPDVDVQTEPGRMPDVDVQTPDVDVHTEERQMTVPDVDVQTEERTVTVPDVDINVPDDDNNADAP